MTARTHAVALIADVTGLAPTRFMELLRERADAAADWLRRSINACGGEGSAVYYSRIYRPLRGWSHPYPETTGYIIPTLLDYSDFADKPDLVDLAVLQARWVMSLQYMDGALPGGAVINGETPVGPSIFNTGQMILGLVAAADRTGQPEFLQSAGNAVRWLCDEVNETVGTWTTHGYKTGFSPAYYTRVCWPMLEVWQRTQEARIRTKAERVLDTICGWQHNNGAFKDWSFAPGRPAFTHTIAYTIRGLLESGRILGKDGDRYTQHAVKAAAAMRDQLQKNGRVAGAYDEGLTGNYRFTCLTGNCQLAGIWLKLAQMTGDTEYLRAALQAVWFVIRKQKMHFCWDPNTRGAIAGSSPFWGRYLIVRYPNWATKFFLDAVMETYRLIQSAPGPQDDQSASAS